jgi:hypothetical protein
VAKGSRKPAKQNEVKEIKFNPFPLAMRDDSLGNPERESPPPQTPEIIQSEVDTPCSELKYPSFHPSETPKSRREFQSIRTEPQITRSRARIVTRFCKLTPVLHCTLIVFAFSFINCSKILYVTGFLLNLVVAEPFVQPLNHTVEFLKEKEIIFTSDTWRITLKLLQICQILLRIS